MTESEITITFSSDLLSRIHPWKLGKLNEADMKYLKTASLTWRFVDQSAQVAFADCLVKSLDRSDEFSQQSALCGTLDLLLLYFLGC